MPDFPLPESAHDYPLSVIELGGQDEYQTTPCHNPEDHSMKTSVVL